MGAPEQPPAPSTEEALLAEHAAVDREEAELMRLSLTVPGWLRDNPGLSLTLIYLFASVIGVVFHYMFMKRFGFNVLEFSEAGDFLMVVIREPLTVALALLGVPFYLVYGWGAMRLSRWARERSARIRSTPEKRRKAMARVRRWQPLLQAGFIGIYAILFVMLFSQWRVSRIRAGDFRKVTVHYKIDSPNATGGLISENLALIGTTSRYVFFFYSATRRSDVVPLDAIARLTWDARPRKEREAEAAK